MSEQELADQLRKKELEIKENELKLLISEREKNEAEKEEKLLEVQKAKDILKLPVLLRPQNLQLLIGIGFFSFLIVWVYQPLATRTNEILKLENQSISHKNDQRLDSIRQLENEIANKKDSLQKLQRSINETRSYNDSLTEALDIKAEETNSLSNNLKAERRRFAKLERATTKKIDSLEKLAFEQRLNSFQEVQGALDQVEAIDAFFSSIGDNPSSTELERLRNKWFDLRVLVGDTLTADVPDLVNTIENNRLVGEGVRYVPSPNKSGRFEGENPQYIIMNFTSGRDLNTTVNYLAKEGVKNSLHVLVGRNGEIVQMVDFNEIAWHAGRSSWKSLNGMNKYSLGVELSNAGKLEKRGNDYYAWYGAKIPLDQVFHDTSDDTYWHKYTTKQLEVTKAICQLLVETFNIKEILGHEEISPGRKLDPGPAFPMEEFRTLVPASAGLTYPHRAIVATPMLNFRSQPDLNSARIAPPLESGDFVMVIRKVNETWSEIRYGTVVGYVMSQYLATVQ